MPSYEVRTDGRIAPGTLEVSIEPAGISRDVAGGIEAIVYGISVRATESTDEPVGFEVQLSDTEDMVVESDVWSCTTTGATVRCDRPQGVDAGVSGVEVAVRPGRATEALTVTPDQPVSDAMVAVAAVCLMGLAGSAVSRFSRAREQRQ